MKRNEAVETFFFTRNNKTCEMFPGTRKKRNKIGIQKIEETEMDAGATQSDAGATWEQRRQTDIGHHHRHV